MKIQIITAHSKYLKAALNHFPKGKTASSDSQLIGHYLVSQCVKNESQIQNYLPQNAPSGAPICDLKNKIYWSVSHKNQLVAIAVDRKPVGIDIEVIVQRSPSLFDLVCGSEWEVLGAKSWLNFYTLWTAKEALIKKLNLNLDFFQQIKLVQRKNKKLKLEFESVVHSVQSFPKKNYIYSVCA